MIEGEINWGDEEVRKRSMGDKEARGEKPMGDKEVNWGDKKVREKPMRDEKAWGKNPWKMKR